ncbi:MAG: hypothetical protein ACXWRE_11085 [Pseudobdellovibrionaceae bacterium]
MKIFFLAVSLLTIINHFAFARSKHTKFRAYSYFDDGDKSTQANCDPEKKVPRRMKHEAEFRKAATYLGSEKVDSELQPKDEAPMRKHFFSSKSVCEKYLAQQQKSYAQKNGKPSLEKQEDTADLDDEDTDEDSDSDKSE